MARMAQPELELSFTDARGPAGPIASEGKSGAAALASGPSWTRDLLVLRLARVRRGHEISHHPGPAVKRTAPLRFT